MKKQGAIQGAVILAVAGFIVKILGALFKIPIGAILGPEGNGIFSIAYNIYALLFVIATAGLPVAMSKTVAEAEVRGVNSKSILKKVIAPFGISGAVLSLILFFAAPVFAKVMGAESAAFAIRVISPAVFFVSISAILRGYFQGLGNMGPTAASEIVEAASKLVFGIAAAFFLLICGCDKEILGAGATLGVTLGTLISMCYLLWKGKGSKTEGTLQSGSGVVKSLAKTALPITMGASILSLTNVIDSGLVMNILSRLGFSNEDALWQFGAYNYATTVFNLPGFLVTTLGISIVPTVTGACVLGKYKEMSALCETSLKLIFALSAVAAGGLFVLSEQVIGLLYGGVGNDAILTAGRHLKILAICIPMLSLSSLCASILQASGDVKKPMYATILGAVFKVFFNFVLISIPWINIYGASISTLICYFVTCFLNLFFIKKKREISISIFKIIAIPSLCAVVTTLAAKCLFSAFLTIMGNKMALMGATWCGVLVWVSCVMLFRLLKRDEVKALFSQKNNTIF